MSENNKFRLRPKAYQDLEKIYNYSYQEFDSKRANQYIKDLDAAFHALAHQPGLGKDYSHVRPNLLAYNVVSHIVFFEISADGITIIRVLHQSMDFIRHL